MRNHLCRLISIFFINIRVSVIAISIVGRAGISLFYTQYQFLNIWWKGALLVFIAWIALLLIQSYLYKRVSKKTSNIIQAVLMIIAIAGLYFSYSDFRHTLSHRWLGERFHLGVYLFWLGWIAITIFVSIQKQPMVDISAEKSE
jgi:membrane protein implicated in regulation of membrane protease activity